jgi:hypothetical protein
MKESALQWPLISEAEQERQLRRLSGAVLFSEELTDPVAAETARRHYISTHPEQPLLAFVIAESTKWLLDLAHHKAESESDKYLLMASFNLVNCIAYAEVQARRA